MEQGILVMVTLYLTAAVKMATPLVFAALGETISEKAGLLNISVEGNMLAGAFAGFLTVFFTGNLPLGFLMGILGGMTISLIHAVMSIHSRADQTIVGLALNFFTLGLTSFLFYMVFGQSAELPACDTISKMPIPFLSSLPLIGPGLFGQDLLVYIAMVCVVLVALVFYRTEWGVILHAVGEHPKAADTAGLSVYKTRYLAGLLNGAFGGLGGAYMTLGSFGFFIENITAGRGYIALAVVVLGKRNPVWVFLSALVIGMAEALQYSMQTLGVPVPSQVFTMFPYVVAVLVLLASIGKTGSVPSALGLPYERNTR